MSGFAYNNIASDGQSRARVRLEQDSIHDEDANVVEGGIAEPQYFTNPLENLPLHYGAVEHGTREWRSWPNPNITADPLYATESKNIFLRLQNRSLQDQTVPPLCTFLLKPPPPPDDMNVEYNDSNHLSFFIREAPRFMGCICGTPQMINIVTQSVNQPIVRHTIIAFSSAVNEAQGDLVPLSVYRNVQAVIPKIQLAITESNLNNSHLVSVTFLAWLSLTISDFPTARAHLRGLLSMLQATKHISPTVDFIRHKPNPLAMFLFCVAVKADNYIASRTLASQLAVPPIRFVESYHREWLHYTASSEMHLQYCLATLQLDGLANNICHLQRHAMALRAAKAPNAEQEITKRVTNIKAEHKTWSNRPYIHHHLLINAAWPKSLSSSKSTPSRCFLAYPEYIIFDPIVAYMHMTHASLIIQINLIVTGQVNSNELESCDAAILVCRIFAALKEALGRNDGMMLFGCITALLFAGLIFTDYRFQTEFEWINKTLRDIDRGCRYRAATRVSDALIEFHAAHGVADPWEIIATHFIKLAAAGMRLI